MSALGQKRTFYVAVQESALPPKADIWVQCNNVRLVPIADIGAEKAFRASSRASSSTSPNVSNQKGTEVAIHRLKLTSGASLVSPTCNPVLSAYEPMS